MPTTIIKTLGNGGSANGYDCADFNEFAALVPANLVTADEQWVLEVYATHGEIALTTTQTISGKTTDATRNIIIRAAAGQSFNDNPNKATNALRYNASNGAAITNNSNAGWLVVNDFASVSRIEGLQFRDTNTTQHTTLRIADTGVIDKSIVECAALAYQNGAIRCGKFINSVAYTLTNSGNVKVLVRLSWNGAANACVGSTLYSASATSTIAIGQSGGSAVVNNCAVFGFGAFYSNMGGGGSISPTHCATNLSGIGGSNNTESLTAADQVESLTAGSLDFRAKTGSALINAGSRAQTYTGDLDALKQDRSTTTPTIGAFEVVSGGGGATATISATLASITGSVDSRANPRTAIAATLANVTGSVTSGSGSLATTISATMANVVGAITSTGSTANGTFTSEVLKDYAGNVLANTTLNFVRFYNDTTGALVLNKTGVSTNGSGIVTFSDASLVAGTTYRVDWETADGSRRMPRKAAA